MGFSLVDEHQTTPSGRVRFVPDDGGNRFGPKSGVLRQLADVPIGVAGGVAGLIPAVVGLGDIATGGAVGDAVGAAGSLADKISLPDALRPTKWQDKIQSYYTPEMKAAKAAAHQSAVDAEQQAKDEGADWKGQIGASALGGLKGVAENPRAGLAFLTENYGGMKAIAKGTEKVLARYLPEIDAAVKAGTMTQAQANARVADLAGKISPVGEGILTAGQGAQQVRAENPNATAADYLLQAPAGFITGAIARGVGKIPGLENVEATMALNAMGRPSGFTGSVLKRAGKGVLSEGVLQEVPQSAQEQAWVNAGTGKPLQEGVGEAAVQGLIAGGAMGGGAAGMSGVADHFRASATQGVDPEKVPGQTPPAGSPSQDMSAQALVAEALAAEMAAQPATTSNAPAGDSPSAAPTVQTNQAGPAGAPIPTTNQGEQLNGDQAKVTVAPEARQQESGEVAAAAARRADQPAQGGGNVSTGAGQQGVAAEAQKAETRADFYERLAAEREQPGPAADPARAAQYRAKAAALRADAVSRIAQGFTTPAQPTTGGILPQQPTALPVPATVGKSSAAPAPSGWQAFPADSGTLGIARADMPQVKSEHRGALVNFLAARGVSHKQEDVAADSLRPTQAEFSPAKVKKAAGFTDNNRSILVSSDNHVLDGHHQWLASLADGKPVKVVRLDAPIGKLIELAHEFPSSTTAKGLPATTGKSDEPAGRLPATTGKSEKPAGTSTVRSKQSTIQKRDDLVGAIMRATGGDGIAASMATDIAGDTAQKLTKLRGLFTNRGTQDLGDVAMLLREQEGFDVRDGEHLSELIRNAAAGDVAVSMERMQRDKEADQERQHRDMIRAKAKKLGVRTVGVKFDDVDAAVLEAERRRHDLAVEKLNERDKKRFDAAVKQLEQLVSVAERQSILQDVDERGLSSREKWQEALFLLRQFAAEAESENLQGVLDNAIATSEEPDWFKDFDEEADSGTGAAGSSVARDGEAEAGGGVGQDSQEQGGEHGERGPVRSGSEADSQSDGQEAGFELAGQSSAEIAADEAAKVAEQKAAAEAAAQEAKDKKAVEQKALDEKVKARAADPDNFQFGEDAKAAANPAGGLFDQPAQEAKPAESQAPAKKPETPQLPSASEAPATTEEESLGAMFDEALGDVFDKAQAVIAADLATRRIEINGVTFGPTGHYGANKAVADAFAGLAEGEKLSMVIDGKTITTKGAAEAAITAALGDSTPFVSEAGGKRIISRSDFARAIRGVIGHEFQETPETAIGSIAGIPVVLSAGVYGFRDNKLVTLESAEGHEARISESADLSAGGSAAERLKPALVTVQNMRPLVVEFEKSLERMERNEGATNRIMEQATKARESIPVLEGVLAEPFKKAEELEQKKARLDVVEKELDGRTSNDVANPNQPAVEGDAAVFSRSDTAPLPESEWLSVHAITEQLEQLGKPFRTAIPVTVVDRLSDIGIESNPDDGVTSGVTFKGKIYLFRDGLVDSAAVARTYWHELLHFGLRRFLTRDQYIQQMGALYGQDGWIRKRANAWMAGEEGTALRAKGDSDGYIRARGVDEALADLAAILQTEPTGYQTNTLMVRAFRAVREWVAKLADLFGFHEAAQAWRGDAAQGAARDLVVSTFAKLREGASPSMLTRSWHYSDPAFMAAATAASAHAPAAAVNPWQKAKAKAAALLTPGRLDKAIYELQDKFIDLRRLRDHIKAIGGAITDMNDAYLGEELYHKRLAHRVETFAADELQPLMADMRSKGVAMEEFETFLHARHAPEANAEMAGRNPNQAQINAGQARAAATVRQLETQLQHAQAAGTATAAIEKSLNDARGELSDWNGAQAFQGTEDERRSLSGMSDAAAAAVMSGLSPAKRAKLDALAARVDAINAGTVKLLDDYGLMNKDALRAWQKTYRYYIPLHRDEAHPDSNSHPIGQGFSTKGDASKRRTGSNAKVTNILGHIAMQRESALTRGEKNHVMLKLYLMARQNPLPDVWKVGAVPMLDTIDKKTGFVKSVPDPLYKNRPNVVMLRIAGKDVAITMNENNPEALRMAHALKNLDVDVLHYIIPALGKITRYFAAINTQYNPIFGLMNLLRDTQEAALNLSTTPIAGKQGEVLRDTLSILKEVLKNKGRMPKAGQWATLFNELREVGGTTGYRDLFLDAESRSKALLGDLKALDRGKAAKAWNSVTTWLSDYNEAMENATRLAAYKAALDSGMSKERAASLAKNLTVNFNRKGRQTRELGALYAFFNAAVQGSTRMVKTLSGPAGRKIMAGGVMLGAMNTLIGFAAMGGGDDGDDEWSKIPEFVKERSIIIPIGKQDYITIPMPLGFQFLPNIGRLTMEMAIYKDKTAGKQMASLFSVLADAFNPLGGSSPPLQVIMPTVMDPFVALAQNRDWTGNPIYRENYSGLDPDPGFARAKDSATPISKGVAEAINYLTGGTRYTPGGWSPTPDQLDYVFGQLTGGVGREIGKATSTVAAPFTGEELPAYKIPLVGRLYGNTKGASGESQKFYENITRANEAENEIKGRLKAGLSITDFLQDNPTAMALAASGNAAERQARLLRSIRRGIVEQDPPDKAAQVRAVNEQIAAVMRGFNRSAAVQ